MYKYWFFSLMMFVSAKLPAQTILFTEFSDGIPQSYTCIDRDGLQPAANMQKKGFTAGKAWIVVPTDDNGRAACSTSYYSPKGTADDWMITPPLKLETADVELRWSAKANNSKFRDGYKVLLSTGSEDASDFTTALFSTDAEENTWQDHAVSLSAWAGKTVRIAFVNNSENKECLLVDNIYAGASSPVFCTLDIPAVTPIGGRMQVNALIKNTGVTATDRTDVRIVMDGKDYTHTIDQRVGPGETLKCALPEDIFIPFHRRAEYSVSAESQGKTFSYTGSVISYPRHVLAEEGTATSCSWCIRGIVMMERMEEKYPDRFISMSLHKDDVMSVEGYAESINEINDRILMISIPAAAVNRTLLCDPANIEVNFKTLFNQEEVLVAMQGDAVYDPQSHSASITSRLHFAEAAAGTSYRLAYYLVEDSVYHPGNPDYFQANAYSGADEDWNGFEKKGTLIQDMRFRNVVRGYNGLFDGVPESVPSSFEADSEIIHNYRFPVPENVDKIEKCHFVAMLIDMEDRHVVNSCVVPLTTPAGLGSHGLDMSRSTDMVEIYTPDGILVARGTSPDCMPAGCNGFFIVRQGNNVRKIMR